MIESSNLVVLTPAIFENLDPIWMLTHTANRFGVPLRPYGMGGIYRGWVDIKIHRLLSECDRAIYDGFTHVLYMDGRDTIWLSPFDEVVEKYNRYGSPPMLMSAQPTVFESYREYYNLALYPTRESLGHPFNLPASPLFMGDAKYIGDCMRWMLGQSWDGVMPDDDPAWWRRFDNERQEELRERRIVFDHNCEIFQNCGELIDGESQWDFALQIKYENEDKSGPLRVRNCKTKSWPCIAHFDSGYSHAYSGKWYMLEEFWKAFGYEEVRPPWERNPPSMKLSV